MRRLFAWIKSKLGFAPKWSTTVPQIDHKLWVSHGTARDGVPVQFSEPLPLNPSQPTDAPQLYRFATPPLSPPVLQSDKQ